MKIAIDITPIKGELEGHKVRGVGSYVNLLKDHLEKFDSSNSYIFFTRKDKLPNNVDLVHYPYFDPFFITLPWRKRFKQVITIHDLIPIIFPKQFPRGKKGTVKWFIQKKIAQKSEAIITDSISSKKDIVRIFKLKENTVHAVYLAASSNYKNINDKTKFDKIREKYKLPEKFALYVGDATWNKNLPRLVKSIKDLNIALVMVGNVFTSKNIQKNPWNYDLFQVIQETENDRNIIKLGYILEEELGIIYNMATLLCMPSVYEGFGLPALEAMQCGCPVVCSNAGSLREVCSDAAYYINPTDDASITCGIKDVFNDVGLQKKLSAKGLLQAKNFTIKKTIENTVKVYEFIK